MPLNLEWIKLCPCCGKFWCDKGEKCGAPDCECIQYITGYDIRHDLLKIVTCKTCDHKIRMWLARNENPTVLTFKLIPYKT